MRKTVLSNEKGRSILIQRNNCKKRTFQCLAGVGSGFFVDGAPAYDFPKISEKPMTLEKIC